MEEKNKKVKKGNKSNSKTTTKKVNAKKEAKEKAEVKEVKKEKKETKPPVTNNEMVNLIKIVLIVTAIFLIFYGITTLVADKNSNDDTNPEDVVIQYDEILLGTLFEQSNSEYYVLVTIEEDYNVQTYSSLVSSYKAKENSLRVYTSNLDNGFNKSYKAEETKVSNNLQELKLKGSTLLKIKDKTIVGSYEGNDIINHLNSLLK